MIKILQSVTFTFLLTCAFIPLTISAQLEYTGSDPACQAPLQSSDFTATELFNRTGLDTNKGFVDAFYKDPTLDEPVRMDLDAIYKSDGSVDYVNIYFVEREGKVKFYNGKTKTVKKIADITVWGKVDNGLMGIALHPDFKQNRQAFIWYSPKKTVRNNNRLMRLSRFLIDNNNMLDTATEKNLIEIIMNNQDRYHSGGPMQFDSKGDLWVTVGNNSIDQDKGYVGSQVNQVDSTYSDEWGASNTASLRGSIFRIHPDNSAKGYSIPQGNFGEYWANQFATDNDPKNDSWAAEYRDPTKVLPELYTKGHRSNHSISVHPTKGWLTWGEVNGGGAPDEFNIVTHPVFGGYPYFHGKGFKLTKGQDSLLGFLQDPAYPRNISPLKTGVENLPPSWEPALANGKLYGGVAMTGPFYIYSNKSSATKFPPHFNNRWLTFDWNGSGKLWVHSIKETDVTVNKSQRLDGKNGLFSFLSLRAVLQAQYGPDGALYIMNYGGGAYSNSKNPGITRVTYNGSCKPTVAINSVPQQKVLISINATGITIKEKGLYSISLKNIAGQEIWSTTAKNAGTYSFADMNLSHQKGIFIADIKTNSGVRSYKIPVF